MDVLFNNAGYSLYGTVEDVPTEEARKQFEVNLFGLANMIKFVLSFMRENKQGTIINTSSVCGRISTPLAPWYYASKFAVEGLSDTLRLKLKDFNIQVVLIEPGLIATNFYGIAINQIKKYSLNSAYRDLARRVINNLNKVGSGNGIIKGTEPEVVTQTITKAVNSNRPKARYLVGGGAVLSFILKILVSDKTYDSVILRQMARKID